MVKAEHLKKALLLVETVEDFCKRLNVQSPTVEFILEAAVQLLEDGPQSVGMLAPQIIKAWNEHMARILQKVLAQAEQVAAVSLSANLACYKGETKKAAELRAQADELRVRLHGSVKG